MQLQGLTVCNQADADLLRISLEHNGKHFDHLCIVIDPADDKTTNVVLDYKKRTGHKGIFFHVTRDNKQAAIKAVLAKRWRDDLWSVIWDANIIMPDLMPETLEKLSRFDGMPFHPTCFVYTLSQSVWEWSKDCLYSPRHNHISTPAALTEALSVPGCFWLPEWSEIDDTELEVGFQLFHPSSQHLLTRDGSDSDFMMRFPPAARRRLLLDVLQLDTARSDWSTYHEQKAVCDAASGQVQRTGR